MNKHRRRIGKARRAALTKAGVSIRATEADRRWTREWRTLRRRTLRVTRREFVVQRPAGGWPSLDVVYGVGYFREPGVPTGSPLAVGAGQTGKVITTRGWSVER